jgi:hypothetical protein
MPIAEAPEPLRFTTNDFLCGLRGYRVVRRRNEEFGVEQINIRGGYDAPWIVTWVADKIPHREFDSYESLRKALRQVRHLPALP